MRSKHGCADMWGHGVSHRASLLGAPMTLPVCSFHARLMPPCMWDQMLPQAYHKIICFSPMRATTYEEPMPVPSVWAWQVANVSQPSSRRIRWQTRESPFRPRVEVETASISNSQTGELPSLCGVNDVCASTASSNMWLATSAQWWSKKPQHGVPHNVLNFKVLETQGGFPKWPSSMAQLTSGNKPPGISRLSHTAGKTWARGYTNTSIIQTGWFAEVDRESDESSQFSYMFTKSDGRSAFQAWVLDTLRVQSVASHSSGFAAKNEARAPSQNHQEPATRNKNSRWVVEIDHGVVDRYYIVLAWQNLRDHSTHWCRPWPNDMELICIDDWIIVFILLMAGIEKSQEDHSSLCVFCRPLLGLSQ